MSLCRIPIHAICAVRSRCLFLNQDINFLKNPKSGPLSNWKIFLNQGLGVSEPARPPRVKIMKVPTPGDKCFDFISFVSVQLYGDNDPSKLMQ